jgi:hypothetical protein
MTYTVAIILSTCFVWIVLDIVLYVKRQDDPKVSTISMIITSFSWYSPVFPFMIGFLMGHWFWPA